MGVMHTHKHTHMCIFDRSHAGKPWLVEFLQYSHAIKMKFDS